MNMEKSDRIEDILRRVKLDDPAAFIELIEIYNPMLQAAVSRYATRLSSGGGPDDLKQEAVITLHRAANAYREGSGVTFGLYAKICVNNRLKSVFGKLNRRYVPFERLRLVGGNPERGYIEREAYKSLRGKLDLLLTDHERRVLLMYLDGRTYRQIAAHLGVKSKSVDNALARIRRKLRESE